MLPSRWYSSKCKTFVKSLTANLKTYRKTSQRPSLCYKRAKYYHLSAFTCNITPSDSVNPSKDPLHFYEEHNTNSTEYLDESIQVGTSEVIDIELKLKSGKLSQEDISSFSSDDITEVKRQMEIIINKDYSNDPHMLSIQKVLKEERERWNIRKTDYDRLEKTIYEAYEGHDGAKLELAYSRLIQTGIPINANIFNTVLSHHASNNNHIYLRTVYEKAMESEQVNYLTYQIMIEYYSEKRDISKALGIFKDLSMHISALKELDSESYLRLIYPIMGAIILKTPKLEREKVAQLLIEQIGSQGDAKSLVELIENESKSSESNSDNTHGDSAKPKKTTKKKSAKYKKK